MQTFVLKGYEVRQPGLAGDWTFLCAVAAPDIEAAARKLRGKLVGDGRDKRFVAGRLTPAIVAKALVAKAGLRGKDRRQAYRKHVVRLTDKEALRGEARRIMHSGPDLFPQVQYFTLDRAPVVR